MNAAQFECIASLLRSRSVSREACRRVLVAGERQCDVARDMDVSPTLIAVSLARYRKTLVMIERAFVVKA